MEREVRVRIAPSPTGEPHVGTAYMGLFNISFARKHAGKFILRIDDTDRTRCTPASESAIFRALRWLNLQYDEGPDVGGPYAPYRQSERKNIYIEHSEMMLKNGTAYRCFCTSERLEKIRGEQEKSKQPTGYDGFCRNIPLEESERRAKAGEAYVVRLKVPHEGVTEFDDLIRGHVEFQNATIDDQVLMKSDGFPTYHLASVVDDALFKISHIIRAEEWIPSTPKHIMIFKALGYEPPIFVHMPLLRNKDKSKISKRKNPTSLDWFRAEGYLPEALLNFLALMGFSLENSREIFTLQEMIDEFDWKRVKTSGPVFDLEKLNWLNGMYIRTISVEEMSKKLVEGGYATPEQTAFVKPIMPLIQERMKVMKEFAELTRFFFTDELTYSLEELVIKKKTAAETRDLLNIVISRLEKLEWQHKTLEENLRQYCEESGWKARDVFLATRIAVTGQAISPPLFESMEVLGRDKCLARLRKAIDVL